MVSRIHSQRDLEESAATGPGFFCFKETSDAPGVGKTAKETEILPQVDHVEGRFLYIFFFVNGFVFVSCFFFFGGAF